MQKILIAAWNRGWVRREIADKLVELSNDDRYDTTIVYPNHRIQENNINQTVANVFLKGDFDYMLFLDHDTVPEKNPLDLVELDKDIIGQPTPIILDNQIVFNTHPQVKQEGLQEIEYMGSASILVARRVFEKMKKPFMNIWDDQGFRKMGGDINFCIQARKQGFKVWAHWDYLCGHIKELDLLRMMRTINALR